MKNKQSAPSKDYIHCIGKHISLDPRTMQRFYDYKERTHGLEYRIDSALFCQAINTLIDLSEGKCPYACIRFPAHFSKDNCPPMLSCPDKGEKKVPR